MLMACSGHSLERDPLPDAAPWRAIADPDGAAACQACARSTTGIARNESLVACVLRDAETHELVREISALRYGPGIGAWHEVLGAGLKREAARRCWRWRSAITPGAR